MLLICLSGWMLAAASLPAQAQDESAGSTQGASVVGQGQSGDAQSNVPAAKRKRRHWPCAQDIKKLCPDAKTWKEKRQCLKDNKQNLSKACQARMKKMHARVGAFKNSCGADVQQFCSSVKGPRAVHQCLKQNSANLSSSCQAFLAKAKAHWKKHHHKKTSDSQSVQPSQQ